jgi:hypothetical protein
MASILTVTCDRCGDEITADRTLLRVECGPLRPRREAIDLCSACAEALVEWMRPAEAPAPDEQSLTEAAAT